jgi:hypothetical protein
LLGVFRGQYIYLQKADDHIVIITYWNSFEQHEKSHADSVFKETTTDWPSTARKPGNSATTCCGRGQPKNKLNRASLSHNGQAKIHYTVSGISVQTIVNRSHAEKHTVHHVRPAALGLPVLLRPPEPAHTEHRFTHRARRAFRPRLLPGAVVRAIACELLQRTLHVEPRCHGK